MCEPDPTARTAAAFTPEDWSLLPPLPSLPPLDGDGARLLTSVRPLFKFSPELHTFLRPQGSVANRVCCSRRISDALEIQGGCN